MSAFFNQRLRQQQIESRRGFSLLEMVVGIAIVGMLMAILLPAVQRSRGAVRRAECSARLREFCLASQNFSTTHGRFPGSYPPKGPEPDFSRLRWSAHLSLLPYLEQSSVQNQVDLSDDSLSLRNSPPSSSLNAVSLKTPVTAFLCPADVRILGAVSFRISGGTSPGIHSTPGVATPDAALKGMVSSRGIDPRSIVDGLSNTAFASERLIGSPENPGISDVVLLGFGAFFTATDAATACRGASPYSTVDSTSGRSWLPAGYHTTWYNHILTPNSIVRDCVNASKLTLLGNGAITARSSHTGGVNVGMCDGATRFVNQNVSERVWRAVGTSSGRESVARTDW